MGPPYLRRQSKRATKKHGVTLTEGRTPHSQPAWKMLCLSVEMRIVLVGSSKVQAGFGTAPRRSCGRKGTSAPLEGSGRAVAAFTRDAR